MVLTDSGGRLGGSGSLRGGGRLGGSSDNGGGGIYSINLVAWNRVYGIIVYCLGR